jgi:hypothetical protein
MFLVVVAAAGCLAPPEAAHAPQVSAVWFAVYVDRDPPPEGVCGQAAAPPHVVNRMDRRVYLSSAQTWPPLETASIVVVTRIVDWSQCERHELAVYPEPVRTARLEFHQEHARFDVNASFESDGALLLQERMTAVPPRDAASFSLDGERFVTNETFGGYTVRYNGTALVENLGRVHLVVVPPERLAGMR